MRTSTVLLLLLPWLAFTTPGIAADPKGIAVDPKVCLGCHGSTVSAADYAASVHAQIACTGCHRELTDLAGHRAGRLPVAKVNCVPCHQSEARQHYASVHMLSGLGCADCHSDIHGQRSWNGDKRLATDLCLNCHADDGYKASVHGRALAAGNPDTAGCPDCHQLHQVGSISSLKAEQRRAFQTAVCIPCHDDKQKMLRNGVSPRAVETFIASYHGKSYRLGFPGKAAGCADCHGAHGILSPADPRSSLSPQRRAVTCARCHPGATQRFAEFYAHGDMHDRQRYPILWWTYACMTGLLIGVFALFWLHSLLWMFRGFVENREKQAALEYHGLRPLPAGRKLYRRFEKRDIFLHLVVIVSFLGLSLTGLPLKFSDQEWAKAMMSFYGGVKYAGLLHRGCAILTFYYFTIALLMSVDFLFVRSGIPGNWWRRLWGPDSLLPNRRDLRDLAGMLKWFFFRGPKPSFERWTYWEKFDFLAVFWGMFAIGGSGLILWFPEFFGRFLPGWIFNVATIIHSDEALLATGFIFTVHFFNTHGRPEKFPMDFVIFNGQISREELMDERSDQWRRYQEQGLCERFEVRKPSGVLFDFVFKGFGFLALLTGMALAFLMFYAFLRG